MFSSTKNSHFNASSFRIVKDPMLQADELPLAEVIDDEKWQVALDRYEVSFGTDPASIDTPAITLWALISQVFSKKNIAGAKRPSVESLRGGRRWAKSFAAPTPARIVALG